MAHKLLLTDGMNETLVPWGTAGQVLTSNGAGSDPTWSGGIAAPTYASTLALNFAIGTVQKVTLTGNSTLSFAGMVAGGRYLLELTQDSTGSRTVTWPAGVRWQGGSAPTLTTTAGKTDLIALIYDGSSTFGQAALNF